MTNSKKDSELEGEPTLRDWLTLLQTNHDKELYEQIANIDSAERAIKSKYITKQSVLEMIGEDEPYPPNVVKGSMMEVRNRLRAELRELLNGDTDE